MNTKVGGGREKGREGRGNERVREGEREKILIIRKAQGLKS